MSKITAEMVPQGARRALDEMLEYDEVAEKVIATVLNMPAIRRLVVEACVSDLMADPEIEGCVCLTAFGIPVFAPQDELITALCGPTTETPE
jgi:hypothetical protein